MKRILSLLAATLLGLAAPVIARSHATLPLDGAWQMRQARGHQTYPAIVPGTVHTDLMAAGVIGDPFMGFGERAVQWVDKEDWVYTRTFDVPDSLLALRRAELCFDGLDTYADVTLNGTRILQADNMFRRWRVAVDSLLKPTGNVLEVYLHSPVKVDLPKWEAYPVHYRVSNDQSANGGLLDRQISVFARKAGYHYGWDWGPRIVTSGIWRSVRLEFLRGAVLRDVFFHQVAVSAKEARLKVEVEVETRVSGPATVAIGADGVRPVYSRQQLEPGLNRIEIPVSIRNPRLWWPAGQGEAFLYDFQVAVQQGNLSCGTYRAKVGLRSVRLVRNADAKGLICSNLVKKHIQVLHLRSKFCANTITFIAGRNQSCDGLFHSIQFLQGCTTTCLTKVFAQALNQASTLVNLHFNCLCHSFCYYVKRSYYWGVACPYAF